MWITRCAACWREKTSRRGHAGKKRLDVVVWSPLAKRYGGHTDSAGHAGNGADIRPEHCGGGHGGCLLYVGGSHNDACCGRAVRSVRENGGFASGSAGIRRRGDFVSLCGELARCVDLPCHPGDWCWAAWRALHHPCGGYGG